jgi:hypothetical protein
LELAYVDQGYTGPKPSVGAQQHGLLLEVVKHADQSIVESPLTILRNQSHRETKTSARFDTFILPMGLPLEQQVRDFR